DLPGGGVGVEWDVRACISFRAEPGHWQRLRPGAALPT
ncbi:MAG: Ycf34 family protein, partial [Prochlorococcaceae cyanobacterium]